MLLHWTLRFNFWSRRDSLGVAEVVDEVSKHFTGARCSFSNGFLRGFAQLPKYIYLKDCLPFWGNRKPLIDFWEGTREVLKGFPGKLLVFSSPCLSDGAESQDSLGWKGPWKLMSLNGIDVINP